MSIRIELKNQQIELLPERAVHWVDKSTLLVADVHWGKTETFRARGIPLPDGVFSSDLLRLSAALKRSGAKRLVVLGDLVHARDGLTEEVRASVERWRKEHPVELVLVRGNHDTMRMPSSWEIEEVDDVLTEGPFTLSHEPVRTKGSYVWGGHIHPMVRLVGRGDSLRLACFHIGEHVGALPAFSEMTRGLNVRRGKGDRIFVPVEDRVIEV